LTAEDHLLILMQAGNCLSVARGLAAAETRVCYERAEALCYSLNRPLALYAALMGQWRCSLNTDTLPATLQIAQRVYSLVQEQQNSALMIGACAALGITHFFLGDFEDAQRYLEQGLELWPSGGVSFCAEDVGVPTISCLCYKAECYWHVGRITECHAPL